MKVSIKKEFDGSRHVASCENVPGCYVQAATKEELMAYIKRAFNLYKKSCNMRNKSIPFEQDHSVLNIRLRYAQISTIQLIKIFQERNYHIDYRDDYSVVLFNSDFPFNVIHLPVSHSVSPLIISKIFGEKNAVHIKERNLRLKSSVS